MHLRIIYKYIILFKTLLFGVHLRYFTKDTYPLQLYYITSPVHRISAANPYFDSLPLKSCWNFAVFRSCCLYFSAVNPSFMILPLKYYLNLPFLPPLFQRQTIISTLYRWNPQCKCGQTRSNFSGNPTFRHLPLKSQVTSWPYLWENHRQCW